MLQQLFYYVKIQIREKNIEIKHPLGLKVGLGRL